VADILQENKRRQVQSLRGIAVSLVVVFHFTKYLPSGYVGVDIFFVISGFVLCLQIQKLSSQELNLMDRKKAFKTFWQARFLRLFPAFIVVNTVSLIGLSLLSDFKTLSIASKQYIATLFGVGNLASYSISGDYFNPEPNTLLHLWSLSAEIQIYSFISIVALICGRLKLSLSKFLILASTIGFFSDFLSLDQPLYTFLGINNPDLFSYYSPISHIWQFTLGILAAQLREKRKLGMRSQFFFFAVFVLVYFSTLPPSAFVLIFATLIVFILLRFEFDLKKEYFVQPLILLGDRSYSIYLIHLPILYLVNYSFISVGLDSKLVNVVIALLFTLFLSHHCYEKVEKQFRFGSRTLLKSSLTLFPILVFATALSFYSILAQNSLIKVDKRSSFSHLIVCDAKQNEKRVLVIGDSHAGALSEAVLTAFGNRGFQIHFSAVQSCPFSLQEIPRGNSSCNIRNREMYSYLLSQKYYAIFSTFRNPNFATYTPGSTRPEEYLEENLISGIEFLNSRTKRHYLFLPNSELLSPTWFRDKLSPDRRIRSDSNTIYIQEINSSKNFMPVSTDDALCAKDVCTFRELTILLGHDGNHLNRTAMNRLAEFLKNQGL
jgi:peptidoglycan/LPS O-acetylase OafA/YrhL